MFFQWWLHFRFALACCLIHLDPRSLNPSPPSRSWLNHGLLLMYWLLHVPLCPIQHPSPNALSFSTCVSCSAQLYVYAMYIVWTLLSAPYLPFSHLHCLYLQLGFAPFPLSLQEDRKVPDPPKAPKSSLH